MMPFGVSTGSRRRRAGRCGRWSRRRPRWDVGRPGREATGRGGRGPGRSGAPVEARAM